MLVTTLVSIKRCDPLSPAFGWGGVWHRCLLIALVFVAAVVARPSLADNQQQLSANEIQGNVTIRAQTSSLNATSTSDDPTSKAENCIGVIGGNIKIVGDVKIERSGPAGDCSCKGDVTECEGASQPITK